MKKIFCVLLMLSMIFSLAACVNTNGNTVESTGSSSSTSENSATTGKTEESATGFSSTGITDNSAATEQTGKPDDKVLIDIKIGTTVLTVTLEDNSSAVAFAELLGQGEITVDMHDYGNFEKVGSLPQSIVRNDENITTEPGDIILYQGNSITIYYDTNTYNLTRLGKINGVSQQELKALLGDGNVTATFRLHGEETATKKILVAYFSVTGTTKKIAEYAADVMSADIYEIVPAVPYTSADINYNGDCRANLEMNDKTCRPKINGSVKNMADYDTVFIGYPIWWGEAPRIVSTFVESYDFSGKTVVTFCTSGSSPNNDSVIKALAKGANWISGKRQSGNSTQSDIANWIDSLDLETEG